MARNLLDWVKSLDRDKDRPGFQISTNPIVRGATSTISSFGKPIYNAITGTGQTANTLYQAARANVKAKKYLNLQENIAQRQMYDPAFTPEVYRSKVNTATNLRNKFSNANRFSINKDQQNKLALKTGLGGAGTLLTASGLKAPVLAAKMAAVGGGLSGGLAAITGQDVPSAVGRGIGSAPRTAGLLKYTNPIGEKILGKVNVSNKLGKIGVKGGLGGLVNIGEDILLEGVGENRLPTLGENLLSFGIGAIGGQFSNYKPKQKQAIQKIISKPIYNKAGQLIDPTSGQYAKAVEEEFVKWNELQDGKMINRKLSSDFGKRIKEMQKIVKERFKDQRGAINIGEGIEGAKKTFGIKSEVKPETNVLESYKKGISYEKDAGKSVKSSLDEFYTNWVNRFHPVEKLTKEVETKGNLKVIPEYSPEFALKRLMGAGGTAELRHKKQLNPIIKELGDIKKSDFDIFLKAKRDIELAGRNIKGSNKKTAQAVINELGQKYDVNKMNKVAEDLYSYQRDSLKKLVDSGFIDEAAYKNILSVNQKYVPFDRIIDDVDNYIGLPSKKLQQGTTPVKGIKGSERQIKPPLESIVANTYKIESAVAKNRAAKSIADLSKINPEVGIKEVKGSGPNTISVWDNGKKKFYEVPQDISKVVKGLNEESAGVLVNILSAPARLLRQQATGRNIGFMIPNVVRDQFDAAINAKYGYVPFVDYFNGLGHMINYKYGGGDKVVEQWMNSGGKIFFDEMGGRKSIAKQTSDATNKNILRKLGSWAIGGIETIGELSESPTRVGVFNKTLKKTGNPLIAASESREATLDFARMGAKMKTANSLIPFLNVGVQGFDKMIRTFKGAPAKTTAKLAAYAGLPALMTSLYNNLYHGEEYGQIPDWEKETNYIIITEKKDKEGNPVYIKIPKGNVTQLVANPTDHFITWLKGSNPQTFQQMALSLITDTLPVIKGGSNLKEATSRTMFGNLPQAIKPTTEAVANYSGFRARPIVPEYMKNRPAAERAYESTPDLYKKAGSVLNVSPLQVKNFAEGTFAAGAKIPVNLLEMGKKGEVDINKIPVARRFVGSRSGYGIDRPEEDQFKPDKNIWGRFKEAIGADKVSASSETSIQEGKLPGNFEDLTTVYKSAKSTVENYRERKARIEYGNYKDWEKKNKLKSLEEDYQFAQTIVSQVKETKPEKYYEIQLNTYGKDHPSDIRVPDRAKFAVDKLKEAKTDKDKEKMINEMWESGVLTGQSNGVAQYIKDTYEIDVWNYTGENESIIKTTNSGRLKTTGTKSKKISISRPSISVKKGPALKVTKITAPKAFKLDNSNKNSYYKGYRITKPNTLFKT